MGVAHLSARDRLSSSSSTSTDQSDTADTSLVLMLLVVLSILLLSVSLQELDMLTWDLTLSLL